MVIQTWGFGRHFLKKKKKEGERELEEEEQSELVTSGMGTGDDFCQRQMPSSRANPRILEVMSITTNFTVQKKKAFDYQTRSVIDKCALGHFIMKSVHIIRAHRSAKETNVSI